MSQATNAPQGTIVVDENRIDRASQKLLTRLTPSSWTYGSNLRRAAELSQNAQVFYRMEEHLIPAGFVEEKEREHERGSGFHERRQFRLTAKGQQWLSEHEYEVAVPKSRPETQEMAYEAQEAAESARESVQSYRKKLNRLKNKVEESFEKVGNHLQQHDKRLMEVESRSANTKHRTKRLSEDLEEVGDRVESVERKRENLAELSADRFNDQQTEIDELSEQIAELQAEVVEINEEMNRGHIERWRRKLS
jgi:chromosome segregation ATPase